MDPLPTRTNPTSHSTLCVCLTCSSFCALFWGSTYGIQNIVLGKGEDKARLPSSPLTWADPDRWWSEEEPVGIVAEIPHSLMPLTAQALGSLILLG